MHPTSFGNSDPIFKKDIGFYVFQLPLYEAIRNWLLFALVWGLIVSILVCLLKISFAPNISHFEVLQRE
ncbi:UPF0182 family protein [Richelia sinica]|uniref:UPF0182 family protein n=1 Tax=Richelia sinica TaxID=1357545 RepID=UPI0018F004E2